MGKDKIDSVRECESDPETFFKDFLAQHNTCVVNSCGSCNNSVREVLDTALRVINNLKADSRVLQAQRNRLQVDLACCQVKLGVVDQEVYKLKREHEEALPKLHKLEEQLRQKFDNQKAEADRLIAFVKDLFDKQNGETI